MAHDLRSPLMYLSGRVQLAQRRTCADMPADEFLCELADELQRMERIIADFVLYAQIVEEGGLPESQLVDLNDVAMDAASGCSARARARGVQINPTLATSSQSSDGASVCGCDRWLRAMVKRLLAFALDRCAGECTASMTVARTEDTISLHVAIPAVCIDEVDVSRLSQICSQVDDKLWASPDESGIVIAVAIARAHCGTLSITAQPTDGLELIVQLPAAQVE
jgi:signal transduction histidine kinase